MWSECENECEDAYGNEGKRDKCFIDIFFKL